MKKQLLALLLLALLVACQRNTSKEHIAEEEIEFVDQSVEERTTVEPPRSSGPPPPPPPPPPAPEVEEIFRIIEPVPNWNTEEYAYLPENNFKAVMDAPLSTFSIDVDRASYGIVRRYLEGGQMPPPGAVRTEELINYFTYDYPQPEGTHPFSVTASIAECPWREKSRLLRIGLQGKNIDWQETPPSNFVFLLDVSGSMSAPNKLPLLKRAIRLMVSQMRPDDRVAIVVYAGSSGLVLPSTEVKDKQAILEALESLQAGGSTAGAAGIELAYQIAQERFVEEGNNRVLLATDGDFNVGLSSEAALVQLIEKKRASGLFLSVLGFGSGNYKDARMEQLADHGNGNYAYIDNLQEARKVLVSEFAGTMYAIAKDVKLQLEFNPAKVAAYRLIGYENRTLGREDFNDDKKDAGELGAGHSVTALYELIPTGEDIPLHSSVDELAYQEQKIKSTALDSEEWLTVKLRYKKPDADISRLLKVTAKDEGLHWQATDDDFRFAAAVAVFGQVLKDSKYTGEANLQQVVAWARNAKGEDTEGYRAAFVQLVELAKVLKESQ